MRRGSRQAGTLNTESSTLNTQYSSWELADAAVVADQAPELGAAVVGAAVDDPEALVRVEAGFLPAGVAVGVGAVDAALVVRLHPRLGDGAAEGAGGAARAGRSAEIAVVED